LKQEIIDVLEQLTFYKPYSCNNKKKTETVILIFKIIPLNYYQFYLGGSGGAALDSSTRVPHFVK